MQTCSVVTIARGRATPPIRRRRNSVPHSTRTRCASTPSAEATPNRFPRPVAVRPRSVLHQSLLLLRLQSRHHARLSRARPLTSSALMREIERSRTLFDRDREVVQLHFGGGTPNFLRPRELARDRGDPATAFSSSPRARSRLLDRARSATHRAGDIAELRRARVQPREPRRAGLRPGRASGGQPRAKRRANAAR